MHSQPPTEGTLVLVRYRFFDFVALAKPELTLLSVMTAVGGAYLAIEGGRQYLPVLYTLLGTLLVGAGAGALNMYLERGYDAMMKRTERRPIPTGRVTPREALGFGITTAALGIVVLAVFTHLLAAFLALVTLLAYLFLYTPLKRLTPFATAVGAVPGALPPAIGWAAVRGDLGPEAWSLFAILYFWQIPHFLSLAWLYRADYARAGYRMLTVGDVCGTVTSRYILVSSTLLVPASLLPASVGLLGFFYLLGAAFLSLTFLVLSARMLRRPTNLAARRLFTASLVYMTALVLLMVIDKI